MLAGMPLVLGEVVDDVPIGAPLIGHAEAEVVAGVGVVRRVGATCELGVSLLAIRVVAGSRGSADERLGSGGGRASPVLCIARGALDGVVRHVGGGQWAAQVDDDGLAHVHALALTQGAAQGDSRLRALGRPQLTLRTEGRSGNGELVFALLEQYANAIGVDVGGRAHGVPVDVGALDVDGELGRAGIGAPALGLDRDLDRVIGAVGRGRGRRGIRFSLCRLRGGRLLRGKVDAEEITRDDADDEHAHKPGGNDEALPGLSRIAPRRARVSPAGGRVDRGRRDDGGHARRRRSRRRDRLRLARHRGRHLVGHQRLGRGRVAHDPGPALRAKGGAVLKACPAFTAKHGSSPVVPWRIKCILQEVRPAAQLPR